MPTVEDIINIGFNNHQSGKLEEAEYAYQEALRLDCENAEVCNLIGVLKLKILFPTNSYLELMTLIEDLL
jgi:hypothetical protein